MIKCSNQQSSVLLPLLQKRQQDYFALWPYMIHFNRQSILYYECISQSCLPGLFAIEAIRQVGLSGSRLSRVVRQRLMVNETK